MGRPSDGAPRVGSGYTLGGRVPYQPVPAAAFTNSERRLLDHLSGGPVIHDFVEKINVNYD